MTSPSRGQRRPTWKKRLLNSFLCLSGGYLGLLALLLAMEDWMLYHPSGAADWGPPPASVAVEDVTLTAADGTPLHAWWSAPPGWKPADGAVLFSHGNGGNLSYRARAIAPLQQLHRAVLVFDYPGFGKSGGTCSEAGCYAAGDAAYDWLTGTQRVPGRRIVLYGGSLGGGVATDLAARRPCEALFLVAAFTSFPDMAAKQIPWMPGRWLVHNGFDNLRKIGSCTAPVFIAHSPDDQLIPFSQGQRLFEAARGPKRFFPMPGVAHNDMPGPGVLPALAQFLRDCGSAD
jgi:fermentation-respiration switch protein FrsA (DUF1100 family)